MPSNDSAWTSAIARSTTIAGLRIGKSAKRIRSRAAMPGPTAFRSKTRHSDVARSPASSRDAGLLASHDAAERPSFHWRLLIVTLEPLAFLQDIDRHRVELRRQRCAIAGAILRCGVRHHDDGRCEAMRLFVRETETAQRAVLRGHGLYDRVAAEDRRAIRDDLYRIGRHRCSKRLPVLVLPGLPQRLFLGQHLAFDVGGDRRTCDERYEQPCNVQRFHETPPRCLRNRIANLLTSAASERSRDKYEQRILPLGRS